MTKRFHVQTNIGSVRYVVNHHDGIKSHRDGSPFFDIATFKNKKKLASFVSALRSRGYIETITGT